MVPVSLFWATKEGPPGAEKRGVMLGEHLGKRDGPSRLLEDPQELLRSRCFGGASLHPRSLGTCGPGAETSTCASPEACSVVHWSFLTAGQAWEAAVPAGQLATRQDAQEQRMVALAQATVEWSWLYSSSRTWYSP